MRRDLTVKGHQVRKGDLVIRHGVVREIIEVESLAMYLRLRLKPGQPGLGRMYVTPNQDVRVSRKDKVG